GTKQKDQIKKRDPATSLFRTYGADVAEDKREQKYRSVTLFLGAKAIRLRLKVLIKSPIDSTAHRILRPKLSHFPNFTNQKPSLSTLIASLCSASMAGKDLEELGSLRKRKRRTQNKKKLLVGDKVEVRSLEDGFQGSWHPGIVTACKKQGCRQVQYDHILYDDWSGNLVDVVSVSPILDGIGSFTLDWSTIVEAWWEGVIFDHEDGSEERRIFFPDLGDELKARIDTLRITHDWDEVTENWKRRGTWIFLELLEQYNQERYIAVSVKQIWYDVREKEPFEWTSLMRHVWEELVLEVINDNISITVDELFGALDKSGFFSQETQVELESAVFVSDANMNPKENMADSLAIVPVDELLNSDLVVDREDAVNKALNCSAEIIDERHLNGGDEGPNMNSLEYSDISFQTKGVCVYLRGRSTLDWRPLDTPAEFCPDAVDEYADFVKGMSSKFSTTVVKQHISYLGWKIHSAMDKGRPRLRYLSPAGEYEYSLRQVCKNLKKRKKDTLFSISQDAHQDLHGSAEESLLIEQPQEIQHPNYYPQKVESPCSKVFIFKPEYCPEAVVEYYMHAAGKTIKKELRKMISKAKKHLSAVGWVFVYLNAKSRNFHYRSPSGVLYRTLKSACKSCMDEGVSEKRPAECMYVVEEDEGQLTRNKLCSAASNLDFQEGLVPLKRLSKKWSRDSGNVKVQGRRKRQRKRNDTLSDLAPDLRQRQPYLMVEQMDQQRINVPALQS
ncbi:PHD finger transcription factor, putative, partial [Prunus dulcis]